MTSLFLILQLFFCLSIPALMIWAEKRSKLVSWLGPVILCYAAGLAIGNLPWIEIDFPIAQTTAEVSAVLAIPLVLFSTNLRAWLKMAPKTILSFAFCILSAILATSLAFWFMHDQLPESWKMAGMTIGVYTGGTPNLNAIAVALDVPADLVAKANVVDLLVSVPYLLLLFTVGHRLVLLILPPYQPSDEQIQVQTAKLNQLPMSKRIMGIGASLLLGGICLGVAVGLGELSGWEEKGGLIIASITIFGLLASLVRPIRELPGSYETGEYLLLIFCVAIGLQLRLDLLAQDTPVLLSFFAMAIYGGILLHLILAKLFKIDADTMLITSVAAVYSPVFVPPIAKVMRNRDIIPSGMTTGVIGFAVGNFTGLGIAYLFRMLLG